MLLFIFLVVLQLYINEFMFCMCFVQKTMDMQYLSLLYSYCMQIEQQHNFLQDIQRTLLPPTAIPIYYLQPATNLLSKLKLFFEKLILL